jgi:hypothetical protein
LPEKEEVEIKLFKDVGCTNSIVVAAIRDAGKNCFAFDKAVEGFQLVYSLFKLDMN